MADHDAREVGMLGRELAAQGRHRLPVGEVDFGAGRVAEVDGDHIGDLADRRETVDDAARMQAVVVDAVVLELQWMHAQ